MGREAFRVKCFAVACSQVKGSLSDMKLSEFRGKAARFLRDPPFAMLQGILGKLPFRPIGMGWSYLLALNNVSRVRSLSSRGRGYVRAGVPEDAQEMGRLEDKQELFLERFAEKEHAAVAIIDGKIVGYEWFSDKSLHVEARYSCKIDIPPNALYAYDAFVLPEYRIGGLWIKLKVYSADLMQKLGRDQIIVLVDLENRLSLNTHLRFGFVPFRSVYTVRLFMKTFVMQKPHAHGVTLRSPSLNPFSLKRSFWF